MKKIIYFSIAVLISVSSKAQLASTNSGGQVVTVQPKIMVIPFTKEGEDIRTILESDINKRIAIAKVVEAFDTRGFTTVDFTAKLKAAKDNNALTGDNQSDVKSQIIQMSGADILVQTEVDVQQGQTGTSVNLILNAYEASTGNALSRKVGLSGKFYTDDISKLATKAVESVVVDFLNVMQSKFSEMVVNGKSIIVEIGFDPSSAYNTSSEVGNDKLPLSDQVELWMEKNAYKNSYHLQGSTSVKMIFDDVKIPLKDQGTGRNYTSNKFALELFKFFKELGMQPVKDVKSNTVSITLK